MSSLRNSVQRRSHRERAQPVERARLGLLEKKKDYQKRAKDYNKKKETLKSLRAKAADRNEDEFYFGMMSRTGAGSRLTRGKTFSGTVDNDRGNTAMDMDTVRLLKTQDLGYLRTMRNVAAREVRELNERYILAGGAEQTAEDHDDDSDEDEDGDQIAPKTGMQIPKKIVFCDGADERDQAVQKQRGGGEDDKMGDNDDDDNDDDDDKTKEADRKARHLERLQQKLRNAKKKLRTLANAEYELELQKAKMAKTATSGGITKTGRRIKVRERKR
ncbi:small-subunit processome [Podospora appendiculata]|uniref:U3 small nucleolar RNA-associated protein 11 n=1 Tax=Podospora appendiculata TaxID=314037 RepID=A0AAE0XHW5_9PEZI|nr:small-subunit processome [Podospora appendiculata]